jgi:hypothetical protein
MNKGREGREQLVFCGLHWKGARLKVYSVGKKSFAES